MHRFNKILFVSTERTGDAGALKRVGDLAKRNGAAVHVLQVRDDEPSVLAELLGQRADEGSLENLQARREKELDALVQPLKDRGLEVSRSSVEDDPFERVIQMVREQNIDLVAKEPEGEGGSSYLFGSLDRALMRACPCATWFDKPHEDHNYKRVMAAVDIGDYSDADLNRAILNIALGQADCEGAELHVVNAWRLRGESTLRSSAFAHVDEDELNRFLDKERSTRIERLDKLVEPCRDQGVEITEHVIHGMPARAIVALANDIEAELVVLGMRARKGVLSMMRGNTAETVMGAIDSSLLVVKAANFDVPAELKGH
ncbi:MAG: universal stress protein [Geminicoccaceae bacterium]